MKKEKMEWKMEEKLESQIQCFLKERHMFFWREKIENTKKITNEKKKKKTE